MVVDIDFRKWPDRPHWRFPARRLGSDAYGEWLATTPPTAYTGPQGAGTWEFEFVLVVPHEGSWVAAFHFAEFEVYVDVTTPPRWLGPDHVSAVDLDLDVVRFRDGRVALLDEEEFADHRVLLGYPDEIVESALATARELVDAIQRLCEPFGRVGSQWVERARGTPTA